MCDVETARWAVSRWADVESARWGRPAARDVPPERLYGCPSGRGKVPNAVSVNDAIVDRDVLLVKVINVLRAINW